MAGRWKDGIGSDSDTVFDVREQKRAMVKPAYTLTYGWELAAVEGHRKVRSTTSSRSRWGPLIAFLSPPMHWPASSSSSSPLCRIEPSSHLPSFIAQARIICVILLRIQSCLVARLASSINSSHGRCSCGNPLQRHGEGHSRRQHSAPQHPSGLRYQCNQVAAASQPLGGKQRHKRCTGRLHAAKVERRSSKKAGHGGGGGGGLMACGTGADGVG